MSVFNRLKINLEKMFFLRDGEEFHYFDRSVSLIANDNEKENQAIQILGYNKEEDNNELIDNYNFEDLKKNKRKYIMKTFSILLAQLSLIIFLTLIEWIYNANDKFNKSFGIKFAAFFIVILILSIQSLTIFSPEKNKGKFQLFDIIYILCISIFCNLLTNFTNFKFILFVLFIFLFNYLIIIIYFAFKGSFNIYFIMLTLLLINTIIAILSYFLWKALSIRIIINISIILFVFILYNAICVKLTEYIKEKASNPMESAIIISYAIFIPSGLILFLIFYLMIAIIDFSKPICNYLCCNCCE